VREWRPNYNPSSPHGWGLFLRHWLRGCTNDRQRKAPREAGQVLLEFRGEAINRQPRGLRIPRLICLML
jgi:hypothetical protein